jgi:hypothetical protein
VVSKTHMSQKNFGARNGFEFNPYQDYATEELRAAE